MKLRHLLLLITCFAFVATAAGGYLYYANLNMAATVQADRKSTVELATMKSHLSAFLAEQLKPVRVLAGLPEIRAALASPSAAAINRGNALLDHFHLTLGADVCYLMAADGTTVASSNRGEADSFVGRNFSFRPYFQQAMAGRPAMYMALGSASGRKGVYYSYPVFAAGGRNPLGVVVIKAGTDPIEEEFRGRPGTTLLLVDPHGIIFLASSAELVFRSLAPLSDDQLRQVESSRQFGAGPWPWSGLAPAGDRLLADRDGRSYAVYRQQVEEFPDWQLILLHDLASRRQDFFLPVLRTTGMLALPLLLFIGTALFALYRKASSELRRRREAEQALAASEQRYRTLYLQTPALLHSIDPDSRLVSVSDHWLQVLDYRREEVVGRPITDFMTPESRKKAEKEVIPAFLRTGSCKDIPYQFVKKDGESIDVLLSAIAERDETGRIRRSLAILVDVTELKGVEHQLQQTTKELRLYSRELERQVRERTREISSILQHTPAVVSMKDTSGRYLLANQRFCELFGLRQNEVRGKNDHELLPPEIARIFLGHDARIRERRRPDQFEERLTIAGMVRTFLAVRFPLFDEQGEMQGVGAIATDITALKQAQREMRGMPGRILEGQEKERAAVARELHDELGGLLTALRMDAVWLRDRLETEQTAGRCREMCSLIDRTIDEVRSLAVRLRPGVLDDLGLVPALQWLVADFEKRTSISCTFHHHRLPPLPATTSTAIYRITQEALTNIARHAGAAHAVVSLMQRDDGLVLVVNDDGRGFEVPAGDEGFGLGLTGIRERAELIGGTAEITSHPGEGAEIRVVLPLAAA